MSGHGAGGGAAAAAALTFAITPGNNGGSPGVFGYNRLEATNPGAIIPAGTGTFKGVTLEVIRSASSSEDLLIVIAGVRAQSFWRMITIQTTAGTWRTYLAANATFAQAVNTSWSFGTGSSPVFTSTTAPRGAVFFL
jgi:hypothetical protein